MYICDMCLLVITGYLYIIIINTVDIENDAESGGKRKTKNVYAKK